MLAVGLLEKDKSNKIIIFEPKICVFVKHAQKVIPEQSKFPTVSPREQAEDPDHDFRTTLQQRWFKSSLSQCCGTVTIYYGSGSGSGSDF